MIPMGLKHSAPAVYIAHAALSQYPLYLMRIAMNETLANKRTQH